MLGGSAPSQASGAPFRTGSSSRTTVWPPPAHQSDLFNRSFGIYSLFPGPGDTAKTLYTPAAKSSHSSSTFQDFVGTPKVSDAFFPTKFSFGTNGTPQLNSSPCPSEFSRLKLTPKTYPEEPQPYSPSEKVSEEQVDSAWKESRSKRLSNDVIIIKREVEEVNKGENDKKGAEVEEGDIDRRNNDSGTGNFVENKKRHSVSDESITDQAKGVIPDEPDSTEFQALNEERTTQGVSTYKINNNEKEEVCGIDKTSAVNHENWQTSLENIESVECVINKEKCNIKVIDLSADGSGKCNSKKKAEKCSVKVESINDICNRLTEKKFMKIKTPDSSCKSLAITCKKPNELSKLPPTRTLSLPPHNGGCSRTTPITFKHSSMSDAEQKSQNINLEVPSFTIKKEPPDFQKYSMGAAFLNPTPLDNFFNHSGLRDLDRQLLSPVPYSDSFESSSRRKESFLSPNVDHNFLSPSQSFLGARPVVENPFMSPNIDIGEFNAYKNYRNLPKISDNYLVNGNFQKIPDGIFLDKSGCEENRTQESDAFINPTLAENECPDKSPGNNLCSGTNVTPCQVAEVTSASSLMSPKLQTLNPLVVKQESTSTASSSGSLVTSATSEPQKEVTYMSSGQSTTISSTVGSISRQKYQQMVTEMKMPSNSVPPLPVMHRSTQSPTSIELSSSMGAAVYTGGMACDDRSANLITTWPTQTHNPTLWQYSAPIDYPPFPPVGFQLVRDPITGHFLLIPASNIEALQRAILWPSYQPTPPQMIIPPISVQPNTSHLLLDTNVHAVDFLTPDAIHHNTPPHRILVTADNGSKRKISTPTLIKLETTECSNTVVVAACDNSSICSKTQSAPLVPVTESVFYSQRTSGVVENGRRSQATSPTPCLTPVLSQSNLSESMDPTPDSFQPQTSATVTLQDASNQTDMRLEEETEGSLHVACRDKFEPYTKILGRDVGLLKTQDMGTDTLFKELEDDKQTVLKEIQKRKEAEKNLNIHISNVPDVNIKKEIISPSQVDLSGLELLSNSIEQFVYETKEKKLEIETKESIRGCLNDGERKDLSNDACEGAVLLQNLRNGFREVEANETYENDDMKNSKNLGGLGLLCALAEQRFQEEIGKETNIKESIKLDGKVDDNKVKKIEDLSKDEDQNEEKCVEASEIKPCSKDESKNCDLNSNYQNKSGILEKVERKMNSVDEISDNNSEILTPVTNLNCVKQNFGKEEFKSESSNTVVPECNFLVTSSGLKRGPGRPKKLKTPGIPEALIKSRRESRKSKEMSPPVLEKETDYDFREDNDVSDSLKLKSKADISKPPTLTPSMILDPVSKEPTLPIELTPCEVNLIAIKIDSDYSTKSEICNVIEGEAKKRKLADINNHESSSKKRKVGRPKKHNLLCENPLTETIVAKKPKTKTSHLYQPKHLTENSNILKTKNTDASPETSNGETRKNSFVKLDEETMDVCDGTEKGDKKVKKVRPKLKAEPKVREWTPLREDENMEWKNNVKKEDDNNKQKIKIQKKVELENEKVKECFGINGIKELNMPSCVLTTEDLKSDKFPIRTLTVMGGLFYAGQLSAIRAPDVYGITIDGERGHRPHIYSREEILKDSILEVKPGKTSDLTPGTRCCAYWSEQYRCLYPGTVSAPASPDPELDDKFVNVEFDDGDSGKINIDDIRLLPHNYPVVEYDPNPLQSLSKRKRRISGTSVDSHSKERKSVDSLPSPEKTEVASEKVSSDLKTESLIEQTSPDKIIQIFEPGSFLSLESERRHLKKKRREKLRRLQSLSVDGKKKHKKHRCSDEHRHHRHHKKHRKHKHKHGKKHSRELIGELKRQDENSQNNSKKEKSVDEWKKKTKNKCKSVDKSCKVSEKSKSIKPKKCKERTGSVESRSKMAAFLPARQLWGWLGKGFRRPGAKGRARKEFYKTIQRGKERITVGDCAVFLSTGRPDRPYIGRIESMWESWGTNMIVRVKWFYHPEETVGCPATLEYPGALFESPHVDENDVQTISHKCEVLPLKEYTAKIGDEPHRYETIYDNNDIYYLAGYYDPTNTTLKMEPGVK